MDFVPTVKQTIYTEKSPDEVVSILRSVTLSPDKYGTGEDDSTYEGEVKGGGFNIWRGVHFSDEYMGFVWGQKIHGRLYEPKRGTFIKLEIEPRLLSLVCAVPFLGMCLFATCLLIITGIKNGDLIYSLIGLIPLVIGGLVAMFALSINREQTRKEIERLNELLDAELYSGEVE